MPCALRFASVCTKDQKDGRHLYAAIRDDEIERVDGDGKQGLIYEEGRSLPVCG